jgi:hypothetical protein
VLPPIIPQLASDISTSCTEYLAILLLFSFQKVVKLRSPISKRSRCSQKNQLRSLLAFVLSIPCIFSPWQIYGNQYQLCLAIKLFLYALVLIFGIGVAVPVAIKIRAVLMTQISRSSGATQAVRAQAKRSLLRLRRLFFVAFSLTFIACAYQLYAAAAILLSGKNSYGKATFSEDAYLALPAPKSLPKADFVFRACQYMSASMFLIFFYRISPSGGGGAQDGSRSSDGINFDDDCARDTLAEWEREPAGQTDWQQVDGPLQRDRFHSGDGSTCSSSGTPYSNTPISGTPGSEAYGSEIYGSWGGRNSEAVRKTVGALPASETLLAEARVRLLDVVDDVQEQEDWNSEGEGQ